MTLFMDVHTISGGVAAGDVAGAHEADLATQGAHGVNYLRYWVDESAGKIFCLVEAPNAEAANSPDLTTIRPPREPEPDLPKHEFAWLIGGGVWSIAANPRHGGQSTSWSGLSQQSAYARLR